MAIQQDPYEPDRWWFAPLPYATGWLLQTLEAFARLLIAFHGHLDLRLIFIHGHLEQIPGVSPYGASLPFPGMAEVRWWSASS